MTCSDHKLCPVLFRPIPGSCGSSECKIYLGGESRKTPRLPRQALGSSTDECLMRNAEEDVGSNPARASSDE